MLGAGVESVGRRWVRGRAIPRVGDEVVVDFLNGDPDEPIVTGRVFNGEKMPPWGLPGSATQSGLLSRSSPGGTTDHANAFRFEDKKGAEQLWMHAERNFDAETEPIIRFPSGTTIRIRSGTTKRCR